MTPAYIPPLPGVLFKRRINAILEDSDDCAHEGLFSDADALVERAREEIQQRKAA